MMPRECSQGRLRTYEACLNCRRKKTRCPGERPVCSNCSRLNQTCLYTSSRRASHGQSEDRLASLEEKVNLIMKGSRPAQAARPEQPLEERITETPEPSPAKSSNSFPGMRSSHALGDPFTPELGPEESSIHLASPTVAEAVDLYFHYCHRQPIWCFNHQDLEDMGSLPKELVYSILTLTSRFSRTHDRLQFYSSTARTLIMLRVANGTVDLETIESLCLLAYSFFIDGNVYLGQFHLGFAFQLCRSAMLDIEANYPAGSLTTERKKRLFWSLLSLGQYYGQQDGLLRVPAGTPGSSCVANNGNWGARNGDEAKPPPFPRDDIDCSASSDIDIWSLAVQFGWVWSRVRTYVSDCAQNKLKEPWRYDSMYSMILSDLTDVENQLSQCHRYDSVKFYERKADEVRINRGYWGPWLKLQFTYHCILTMLNHPFLYIVASQHYPSLAIPNAFWRRSSELALLHATWIVRIIDMASEKKMRLIDPFFGHAAAIAATVHLYYCRAADPRLKLKSKIDLEKCRKFLEGFVSFSPACKALDHTLEKILRIAFGSENVDYDWTPSRIYLSVPLMWNVLRANGIPESQEMSTAGLLHPSLIPPATGDESVETSSTLEIIVAMSPEVTVNTADGGQAAHMPPNMPSATPAPSSPGSILGDRLVAPNDHLMSNTPWLWTDPAQFPDTDNMNRQELEDAVGNIDGFFTWWDIGNL